MKYHAVMEQRTRRTRAMPDREPVNDPLSDLRKLMKLVTAHVSLAHAEQLSVETTLRELRNQLWATCRELGLSDSDIADLSNVTPPAVASVFRREHPPTPLLVPAPASDDNGDRRETAREAMERLGLDISDLSRAVAEHLRADDETS